jgi:crotonobetaine/carnitine-CoA ligase
MQDSKVPGVLAFDMMAMAEKAPDFPVVTFENHPYPDEILTYADLVVKGTKLAWALENQGLKQGDRYCVVMRNHPEIIICMFAASVLGVVLVPIDPRSEDEKLVFQIQDSGSKGIIFAAEFMDLVNMALSRISDVRSYGCLYNPEFGVSPVPAHPDLKEILDGPETAMFDDEQQTIEDRFLLMYTSGSTGNPKGIYVHYDRLQDAVIWADRVWQYTPDDKLYTGLALTHGNAVWLTMYPALYRRIPAIISRKFTKSRLWDICRKHGCTTFSLLGGMMTGIYSEPEHPDDGDNPVNIVLSAGTPRGIWQSFEKRFNVTIHEWYDSMEGGFCHNPPGLGPVGSIGKPLPDMVEIKVVREDDTECDPGEIGELIARNITGWKKVEYHNNPEASADKTRGGWMRSGDMVHRNEDGWLYFDFRKGAGLRRQGEFIMPEYVDGVIAEHPHVSDVCVFGIEAASGAPGESDLVAAIVPLADQTPDIESIYKHCTDNLEHNSVPLYIWIVTSIPKTASEKNLSRVLVDTFSPENENIYPAENYL